MAPLVTGTIALLGQSLGTCTIRRLIGRGDMGAVYVAQQDCPQRAVAVKVLLPELLADQASRIDFLARFRREAEAIAGLDHVNIIPIYEYGEQEQVAYLVMPYVTGGSLEQELEKWNVLAFSEALFLVEQVAAALDYAHAKGIIHRDLKPANLLFDSDGRVLLTDFGLARIPGVARDQHGVSALADAGTIIGTPEYFSPEQVVGQVLDQRSDIYALGIILYQMLTGHVPFSGATPVATAMQHVLAEPPSLSQRNPIISPAIEAVVLQALAKQPEQRYDSAGQLAQAFSAALTSTGIDLERPPWVAYGKASELFTPMTLTTEAMVPSSAHKPVTVVDRSAVIDKQTSFADGLKFRSSTAHTPAKSKKRSRSRSRQAIVLCIMFVLLLLGGSSLTYLYTAQKGPRAARGPQTKSASVSQPQSPFITVTPTITAAPTANPDLPAPAIPVGKLLFGTPLPGFLCDSFSGSWSKTATARITCMASATELATTNPHQIAATFLGALPGGQGVPNDYMLQVQLRQGPHSRGAFGVLFRNQAGSVLGAYGFLLSSNGNWSSYVYDNVTKKAMQLYTHRTRAQLQGLITIDIRVQKDTFLLYIDGHEQGNIVSPFYTSGTVGLAVDTAADVFFSNFALYALPNK
ncbi:MAG TPA: serine/threonine-protein kinase [Ktedonobacteraceae bacterium]|nr:serine/threonine-protein kinase [Ktedonobacteraceae bacterium]